jgi:hypothetical protein
MNIDHFTQLSEGDQLKLIHASGIQIAERKSAYCDVKLYQLGGFYIELYHHTHFNVIVNINAFTSLDMLDPYLDSVVIDNLIYAS